VYFRHHVKIDEFMQHTMCPAAVQTTCPALKMEYLPGWVEEELIIHCIVLYDTFLIFLIAAI